MDARLRHGTCSRAVSTTSPSQVSSTLWSKGSTTSGSSGHGVMHAPALGQLLAEIVADGTASTLDAHALRPSRFAEDEPNLAPTLL